MNYLSNQCAITLFAHLFDQSVAITVFHTFQQISVPLQFFSLIMVASKQHNTALIAHSSMELKYRSYDYVCFPPFSVGSQ